MYGLLFYSFSYGTMSFYVHNLSDKYAFIFAIKALSFFHVKGDEVSL